MSDEALSLEEHFARVGRNCVGSDLDRRSDPVLTDLDRLYQRLSQTRRMVAAADITLVQLIAQGLEMVQKPTNRASG